MLDIKEIKRGNFIKRSFLKGSKKWLVIGVSKCLPTLEEYSKTKILISSEKGNIMRITIQAVKAII